MLTVLRAIASRSPVRCPECLPIAQSACGANRPVGRVSLPRAEVCGYEAPGMPRSASNLEECSREWKWSLVPREDGSDSERSAQTDSRRGGQLSAVALNQD